MKLKHLRNYVHVIVLIGAISVLFFRILSGGVLFWGTPMLQFYPWRDMAFDLLRQGQLPLWNPFVGNGAPLLANYQTAVFYPPNWLYLVIPTEHAMGWVGVLHMLWAGLGMLVYLRRLGVDQLGQGVAAISFALNGYLISRFGFLSITSTVPWLPWLLWAVDGVLDPNITNRTLRRQVVILALICGMLLLAGHAQTAFYSLVMAGAYTLWRALLRPYPDRQERLLRILLVGGTVTLGVGLAAIQLVPTFELMQLSQRATGVEQGFGLTYSFWPWRFLAIFSPNIFGSPARGNAWGYGTYWEDALYVGLFTLIAGIRALVHWRQSADKNKSDLYSVVPFYLCSLPLIFLLALGKNTPVFPWLYQHIPTFDMFQAPARWLILVVFALSVLGGIGAHEWKLNRQELAWARRGVVIGIAFLIGVGGAFAIRLQDVIFPTLITGIARTGVVIIISCVAIILLRYVGQDKGTYRQGWEALVLCLLAADLVVAHFGLNPVAPAALYEGKGEIATTAESNLENARVIYILADEQAVKFDYVLDVQDFHGADIEHWQWVRGSLLPNLNMLDEVASASNFDPLLVGHYSVLFEALDAMDTENAVQQMAAMNVGVIVTPDEYEKLELVTAYGPLNVYSVPNPWARASLAECDHVQAGLACVPVNSGKAVIISDDAQQITVDVTAETEEWLLLLDTYYPGWEATVDGEIVSIERANQAFRAIQVPEGEHQVTFTYRPKSIRVGAAISIIALVSVIGLYFWPEKSSLLPGDD